MTKSILALTILLTGFFAAHDVLANSAAQFSGYFQSKETGCALRVHVGTDFGGLWIVTRSESNNGAIPPCNTGFTDFTERSECLPSQTGDIVCRPEGSTKKRGEILLKKDGTMERAENARFGGVFVKTSDAPVKSQGKQ